MLVTVSIRKWQYNKTLILQTSTKLMFPVLLIFRQVPDFHSSSYFKALPGHSVCWNKDRSLTAVFTFIKNNNKKNHPKLHSQVPVCKRKDFFQDKTS